MMDRNESQHVYRSRINQVVHFIDTHLARKLNLEELARAAFFSPFHFHRLFTGIVGETPNEFVNRLRLEKAANMMQFKSNLSITDIAFQCGFSSSAVFSRSFKARFNLSPTEWRILHRNGVAAASIKKSKIGKEESKIGKSQSKIWKADAFLHDYLDAMKSNRQNNLDEKL